MLKAITTLLLLGATLAAHGAENNDVVVSRGTAHLTFKQIDAVVRRMPPEDRAKAMDNPTRIDNTLNTMLLAQQLADQARANGLDKDPEFMADIEWMIVEKLAAARTRQFESQIKVPPLEELAKETYLANKADYMLPASRVVRHLLVQTKDDRDEKQAEALAEKLRAEAVAHPDRFQQMVVDQSDDSSKRTTFGVVRLGDGELDPAFADAAKKLSKVGEISPVVRSSFGWHIIKLEQDQPARQRSFDEVKDQILAKLRAKYIDQTKRQFIDELRNEKIEADPALVESIRTRYAKDAGASAPSAEAGQKH